MHVMTIVEPRLPSGMIKGSPVVEAPKPPRSKVATSKCRKGWRTKPSKSWRHPAQRCFFGFGQCQEKWFVTMHRQNRLHL